MAAAIFLVDVLLFVLAIFAGPYRSVAYKTRTFPSIEFGFANWLGILFVYPPCLGLFGGPDSKIWLYITWPVVAVMAYAQMISVWSSGWDRRDPYVPQSWMGAKEPYVVGYVVLHSLLVGNPGVGVFTLLGFAASRVSINLLHRRDRLLEWTPEDSARVTAPVRVLTGKVRGITSAGSMAAAGATAALGAGATKVLAIRKPQQTTVYPLVGEAAAPRPATFTGRVMSYLVARAIFAFVVAGFPVGPVFSVLAIPAAMFLAWLGWETKPPEEVRDKAESVLSRAEQFYHEEKDDLVTRLELEKEELREKLEEEGQRLREKAAEQGDRLKDKAREQGDRLGDLAREKGREFGEKVEDKVEEKASGLFWRSIGW